MKIVYIENNQEIIKLLTLEFKESHYEIFIFNEFEDALLFVKETKNIDLIVLGLELTKIQIIMHLRKIRSLSSDSAIILVAELESKLSFSEFKFLDIRGFIKKPFGIKKVKKLFYEIEKKKSPAKYNSKETQFMEYNYLQIINQELNLSLKQFKEFSYYSETDLDGNITEISDTFSDILGYKNSEIIGKKHSLLKHSSENPSKYVEIWKNITKGNNWIGELRCKDKNQNDIWYKTIIFPVRDLNGEVVAYGAKRQDITDKKAAELSSITDHLTTLYNKRFFSQIFASERNRAKRNKKTWFFLY